MALLNWAWRKVTCRNQPKNHFLCLLPSFGVLHCCFLNMNEKFYRHQWSHQWHIYMMTVTTGIHLKIFLYTTNKLGLTSHTQYVWYIYIYSHPAGLKLHLVGEKIFVSLFYFIFFLLLSTRMKWNGNIYCHLIHLEEPSEQIRIYNWFLWTSCLRMQCEEKVNLHWGNYIVIMF